MSLQLKELSVRPLTLIHATRCRFDRPIALTGSTPSATVFWLNSPNIPMTVPDPAELKRKLRAEGFEIYRTVAERILLAERIRDNLIMDSGVAADLGPSGAESAISVQVTVRAQASHFPGANETQMKDHARQLAATFVESGYTEVEVIETPVPDPSDPSKSLDTSHEIRLRRPVENLEGLFAELREALGRRRSTSDD